MPDINSVINWLFGRSASAAPTPQGQTYLASPRLNYPTSEDVDFARKYDYSYGQTWAPEFENKSARLLTGDPNVALQKEGTPIPAETFSTARLKGDPRVDVMKDYYAKAALASESSPLAKLGFDPSRTAVDIQRDPHNVNLLGFELPGADQMYANARTPDAIVHESIHRGIDKLSQSPFWKKEFNVFKQSPENEYVVRHLMETKMGDPESAIDQWSDVSKKQRDSARYMFNQSVLSDQYRDALKQMEDAAANYIAAKRPGGPR